MGRDMKKECNGLGRQISCGPSYEGRV